MCRSEALGGRRCPSHGNPIRQKLATATRLVSDWERRISTAMTDEALDHAIERFTAAMASVEERALWDPAWKTVPPPTRVAEFTEDTLATFSADELERHRRDLHFDPLSQRAIDAEWGRRDAAERARAEEEDAAIREVWELTLAPEHLPDLTSEQLDRLWQEVENFRDLQERIEHEWDRRATAMPADESPELDAWGHPVEDDDGDNRMLELSGDAQKDLQWAYENLSAAKYVEVEREYITDPDLWSNKSALQQQSGGTVAAKTEASQNRYHEYQFERYLDAEAYCRGHMLNVRGEAAKIDAHSLLYGSPSRMRAYASDEFKAFVRSTGGHMSYARFESVNGNDSAYGAHNTEMFDDVAVA